MKRTICFVLAVILLATSCQGPTTPSVTPTTISTPTIAITPTVNGLTDGMGRQLLYSHYDPKNGDSFQVDLRSKDLSHYDLRNSENDLLNSLFSTQTKWPEAKWLPGGFDPQKILELGKNPGLGVRNLHDKGITGKGVSIAIIDQPLTPSNHIEYADRVKVYEKIGKPGTMFMHGPAVASIAVGKTVGVAPEANLYFFAVEIPYFTKDNNLITDFTYYAQAVRRILEINQTLPEAEKIKVISISNGWSKDETGYADIVAAVNEAKKAGIFVVSSSLPETYNGFRFTGLGRDPLDEPDQVSSYGAGTFWASSITSMNSSGFFKDRILIPMDSRTVATDVGSDEYLWSRSSGWSWSIPYIAGLYALAVQVNPSMTPNMFWDAVVKTAQPFSVQVNGQDISIGKIIQPISLIETLKK